MNASMAPTPKDSVKTSGKDSLLHQTGQSQQQDELQKLREAARQQSQTTETAEADRDRTFTAGSQSLNALNPEISVTGDFLSNYRFKEPEAEEMHEEEHEEDEQGHEEEFRSGFQFRTLEVQVQSNLDPFSFAKAIVEIGAHGIELSEAYITWFNPLPRVNLTAGKFRQQFGTVNRWHEHALDQTFYPLPIELYMGEHGLAQTGVALEWIMPPFLATANELVVQVTNSTNEILFSGEEFSLPASLVHFKNFYELNPDTYLEWGLSGMAGTNDRLGFTFAEKHTWTYLGGLNLTLSWSPARRALYKGLTWRSELFYLNKEITGEERIKALGGFSYLDYKFSRRWIAGLRVDAAQPPEPENQENYLWQVTPYLTFWQSEFVYLRLQFSHLTGKNLEEADNRILLQVDWSVGPHKHTKY